jgi:hypothetical protein
VNTEEQDTLDQRTGEEDLGNVTPSPESGYPSAEPPARPREEPLKVTVKRRLEAEGRWAGKIELERNDMMKFAKKQFKTKAERQLFVYGELDRLYPTMSAEDDNPTMSGPADTKTSNKAADGQIQGLDRLPDSWPDLAANASLSAEVGWVQANRLRIVEEQVGGATVVHLDDALSPAPSWAALGWLETSIRSYAKFVDVVAKASGADDGGDAVMRRERMAIEEVRALLDEMMDEA